MNRVMNSYEQSYEHIRKMVLITNLSFSFLSQKNVLLLHCI